MSDRSEQALRERLELAKKATPGPWKESVQIVNGDAVNAVTTACGDEICNTYDNLLCDAFDAAHIAANHPDVVCADLEEILALRAEVARLRVREEWLARELAAQGNVYGYEPYCPMSGDHKCEWRQGCDLCGATIKARAECWRKAAEMATRENPGSSGEAPENPGEE